MALYQILETPGKAIAYPLEETDPPLRSQDEAKVVMARLRAEARADGKPIDFVMQPLKDAGVGGHSTNGSGGTSIRLSEDHRRRVAMFIGSIMAETGEPLTMGEGVARLVDFNERVCAFLDIKPSGQLGDLEDAVVRTAKAIVKARKEAAA